MSTKRLYIGNVSDELAADLGPLKQRLEKFGTVETMEPHNNFVFTNMNIEDGSLQKLRKLFNSSVFKGSQLRIELAKPDYKARLLEDQKDVEKKEEKFQKAQWEHYKKIQNIQKSFKDRLQVVKGRERKTARKSLRGQTFRLLTAKKDIKVLKMYKQKLWGVDKNKTLRDLVYHFGQNMWTDGFGNMVDKLDYSRATARHLVEDEAVEAVENEQQKDLLSQFMSNFDFDKPLAVDEEDEEYGASDYEYNALLDRGSDGEEKPRAVSETKVVSFDDYAEGEYAKELVSQPHELPEEGDDEDFEFMPVFGSKPEEHVDEPAEFVPQGTISNTESLRTLFNPADAPSFKLIQESDDDIDHDNDGDIEITKAEDLQAAVVGTTLQKHSDKGLFFPHFDSPFLVAQTQLNQVPVLAADHFAEWESKFWEQRGAWMRDCKNRKRDALRQQKKKGGKGVLV